MRKPYYLFWVILIQLGCEDVIDVEVPIDRPRLTIDAVFRLDVLESEQTVQVTAGLTSGFFEEVQTTDLDEITIINPSYVPMNAQETNELILSEIAPGIYEGTKATEFFTEGSLELHILHEGKSYMAETEYVPTSDIDALDQGDGSLFGGEETEIVVSFTDEANRNDFYLIDLDFNEYLVTEDEFYPGQPFEFSYFYDETVTVGTVINVSILGVDELFYNYMNQVIEQANSGSSGPFQTPAATVRGNFISLSDNDPTDNFVLGYFAICQTFTKSITVE